MRILVYSHVSDNAKASELVEALKKEGHNASLRNLSFFDGTVESCERVHVLNERLPELVSLVKEAYASAGIGVSTPEVAGDENENPSESTRIEGDEGRAESRQEVVEPVVKRRRRRRKQSE